MYDGNHDDVAMVYWLSIWVVSNVKCFHCTTRTWVSVICSNMMTRIGLSCLACFVPAQCSNVLIRALNQVGTDALSVIPPFTEYMSVWLLISWRCSETERKAPRGGRGRVSTKKIRKLLQSPFVHLAGASMYADFICPHSIRCSRAAPNFHIVCQ